MKRKHARPLVIGTMAMIVLGWMAGLFNREMGGERVPLLGIQPEEITAIHIAWPEAQTSVTLAKDENWRLTTPESAPADNRAVAALLSDLANLELDQALTFDETLYPTYGLEDTVATALTLTLKGLNVVLYLGYPVPGRRGQYVRFGQEDPRMYTTDARLTLPASVPYWRDKTILNLAPDDIIHASLHRPEQTFELRGPAPWQMNRLSTSRPVTDAAVAFWLQRFHPLQADSLVLEVPPGDVQAQATHSVTLTTGAETSSTLWFVADATGVLVATTKATYWLAFPERLLRLVPPPRDFLAPTTTNP